jgi:myo-inositol-1(or 4)-monophosphatase
LPSHIEVATRAALAAGRYLAEVYRRGGPSDISHKGRIDIVTECDLEAERLVLAEIRSAFPDAAILAEEAQPDLAVSDGRERWLVDPIDGTTNFAHGLPHFCVSIAVEQGLRPFVGVVYDPVRDELFAAELGRGATRNGRPIQVAQTGRLVDALVTSGFPYDVDTNPCDNMAQWRRVAKAARSIRCLGAAALDMAWVACGRLDAQWELDLEPWDMAAGSLLVSEAGGSVTGCRGEVWRLGQRTILSCAPGIRDELLKLLA